MAAIQKKISKLVDNQLPEFISSDYPKFSAFLQKYYEQLELPGQPLDIITNLTKYGDIDNYERSILSEFTTVTSNIDASDDVIYLENTDSFPDENGYVLIEEEIVFYASKTNNSINGCVRNVSGTTKLGDLYNKSTFKKVTPEEFGNGVSHLNGVEAYNVSNLFLYAFVKNFEKQYLASFPEESLKQEIDRVTLLKNIKSFYRAKGTEQSIKFIFNSIVAQDPTDIPSIYYPKDNTLKTSTSDWIDKYALKVKVISGDPKKVIGQRLIQEDDLFNSNVKNTFAFIDNVLFLGNYDGESIYEVILAPETVVGEFSVAQKTFLTKRVLTTDTTNNRINVFSATGWKNTSGKILIGNEEFIFKDKTVNQFVINSRTGNATYPENTPVYNYSNLYAEYEEDGITYRVTFLALGILYNLNVTSSLPYSSEGDVIQIGETGFDTRNPIIYDKRLSRVRWLINENNSTVLNESLSDVAAIYEDEQYYYIASSGFPSSFSSSFTGLIPSDQKHLKLIKKFSSKTTELNYTSTRDVGVLVNGVLAYGYKDYDENDVIFGGVEEITITEKGKGYKNAPYVLIDGDKGAKAKAILSGEVVERIEVVEPGEKYETNPSITITSGRGAIVTATVTKDKVTKLTIVNPGEYYSTPPIIRIRDLNNAGKLAQYTSIVSTDGKLIGFNKISEGKFYTQANIVVDVIPVGSGATAVSKTKRWKKNRYEILKNELDTDSGYLFENIERSIGYGYAHLANPISLRNILLDNNPTMHSPILGFAYDGNPIYGPYGYSNAINSNSSIKRMETSYRIKTDRIGGPSIADYPLGKFVEDYRYQHRFGDLDDNNGRYCVTPDYPDGVYAYFITVDSSNTPQFPYIVGDKYYSIPAESNYTNSITQIDVPSTAVRLRTAKTPNNGVNSSAIVETVNEGIVSSGVVNYSPESFSVGNQIFISNENTSGSGAAAEVKSLFGKQVTSIESRQTKAIKIQSTSPVYYFDKTIITQENTNATGEVVGDIFSGDTFVLRDVSGNFDNVNKINSSIRVINVIVDDPSFYTAGFLVRLTNGKEANILNIQNNYLNVAFNPFVDGDRITLPETKNGIVSGKIYYVINAASSRFKISETLNGSEVSLTNDTDFGVVASSEEGRGEILETVRSANTLKIKVVDGDFFINTNYYLKSSLIDDTIGSRIVRVDELSRNISIFDITDNIALVTTNEEHRLTEGDKVTIDINPSDALTTTNIYVRKRIYQTVKLFSPDVEAYINDTGVGVLKNLNGGNDYAGGGSQVFTDVELVFADQTRCRDENGLLVPSSEAFIGCPGAPGNARATITVVDGVVGPNSVVITSKGSTYRIGDILTVENSSLDRLSGSLSQSILFLEVSHVGLGISQTQIKLNSVFGISASDTITIDTEQIRVDSVDSSNNTLTVTRGINNTVRKNHFNNALVTIKSPRYQFNEGDQLGPSSGDPIIKEYDAEKQLLTVVFDTNQTLETINKLNFNTTFFDASNPLKLVRIESITDNADYRFEFSYDNTTWVKNPIIEIQNCYRYKFVTSHPSLSGSFLEFSPSRNNNIITVETQTGSVLPGSGDATNSFVDIKLGFGAFSPTNNFTEKKASDYANFYYFDKAGIINSDNGYLQLVEDPLQGDKKVDYVSKFSFAYLLDAIPDYDGTGNINYTTESLFAIGRIADIKISNGGKSYKKIPTVLGVKPNREFECIPKLNYDEREGRLLSVSIDIAGKGYSKPIVILQSSSSVLPKFNIVKGINGEIIAIIPETTDIVFNEKPLIYVAESDVKIYLESNTIGRPKNIKVLMNGSNYYNDNSLKSRYTSHQILTIKEFDDDAFLNGEIVKQFENGFLIAEGRIANDGFIRKTNYLKLTNVVGEFKTGLSITGNLKNKTATVSKVFYSLFSPDIKSYYDNMGYFDTDRGQTSNSSQKIADSYFYQDYSYVVRSKSPINIWRKLVEQTVHPAGFKLFGEVSLEATARTVMPENQRITSNVTVLELWDETANRVTIENTRRTITQSYVQVQDTNIRRGKGSVFSTGIDTSEMLSYTFQLLQDFDGDFDEAGNIVGRTSFNMILPGFGVMNAINVNNLIITIDGILQEPGVAFTVSGSTITFAKAPLGERFANGQIIEAQNFIGRMIRFKNNDLNSQYFRKIQTIENDFDNVTTRFPLYYEDGSDVVLNAKENLLVSLDGVLQENKVTPLLPATSSYYIDRTVTPNQIVFVDAPRKLDSDNRSKFFAYSVGNYERLQLEENLYDGVRKGPFLLKTVFGNRTVNVDNDRTILVFVEGILQIRNRAYTINGSEIYFSEAPRPGQKVNILYLYGRETEKKLTFYNFEDNKFFNVIDILVNGAYLEKELSSRQTIYQGNDISSWNAVGEVLQFSATPGQTVTRFVVRQQNNKFDINEDIKLYGKGFSDIIIPSNQIVSISAFKEDDERNEIVFKTKVGWMVGSELKPKYVNTLDVNDLVKVDGERDYRRITLIPEVLKKLGHRGEDLIENNHYGLVGVTEYNGINDGIGLSVIAGISNGKVINLSWNNRNYKDYAQRITTGILVPKTVSTRNGVLDIDFPNNVELRNGDTIITINKNESIVVFKGASVQPNAYGYDETPQLVFVPQPLRDTFGNIIGPVSGGGAEGFVIMNNGEIIDVVLTNSGSGYLTPPRVYVTRGFNILKSPEKVINSRTDLVLSPKIFLDTNISRVITVIKTPSDLPEIQTISDVRVSHGVTRPTIIVTPQEKIVTLTDSSRNITSILSLDAPEVVSITSVTYNRLSQFFFKPITTTIESLLQNTTVITDFGAVDVYGSGVDSDKYEFAQLGNRFEVYENIKFITDFGVANVSEQNTLEMLDIYYPTVTLGDFADRSASSLSAAGDVWQLTWPSVSEYGAILDNSLTDTDTIVYIPDTSAFPDSGKLLIGNEIVTYTAKLSDRFTGVVRGAEGTTAQSHNAGDYLRSLV